MNRRHAVVAELIELAVGDDYRDRADAGRALAVFAEVDEARETLLRLVLDGGDTFVTLTTAEALLRRQDTAGFTIVARALTAADSQQHTYIHQAVTTVFTLYAAERDHAIEACDALARDASVDVREGAADLREGLAQIHPMLYPAN